MRLEESFVGSVRFAGLLLLQIMIQTENRATGFKLAFSRCLKRTYHSLSICCYHGNYIVFEIPVDSLRGSLKTQTTPLPLGSHALQHCFAAQCISLDSYSIWWMYIRFVCVVMTTTTPRRLFPTPVYHRIHTSFMHMHTHLFLVRFHPTFSHSSSWALPYFPAHSTPQNGLNSVPLSPTSVLSERRYHGNWLQLMGLKHHDWQTHLESARTHAEVPLKCACTRTHTHSLLCKTLWDVAYYT